MRGESEPDNERVLVLLTDKDPRDDDLSVLWREELLEFVAADSKAAHRSAQTALNGIIEKVDAFERAYKQKLIADGELSADADGTAQRRSSAANSQDDSEEQTGSRGLVSLRDRDLKISGLYGHSVPQLIDCDVDIEEERKVLLQWLVHVLYNAEEHKDNIRPQVQVIAYTRLNCNVSQMQAYLNDPQALVSTVLGELESKEPENQSNLSAQARAEIHFRAETKAEYRVYHILRILGNVEKIAPGRHTMESCEALTYEEKELIMTDLNGRVYRELESEMAAKSITQTLVSGVKMADIMVYYQKPDKFGAAVRELLESLHGRTFEPFVPDAPVEADEGDTEDVADEPSTLASKNSQESDQRPKSRPKSRDDVFSDTESSTGSLAASSVDSSVSTAAPSAAKNFNRRWQKAVKQGKSQLPAILEYTVASSGLSAEDLSKKSEKLIARLEDFVTPSQIFDPYDRVYGTLGYLDFEELQQLVETNSKGKRIVWMHLAEEAYLKQKDAQDRTRRCFVRNFVVVPKRLSEDDPGRNVRVMFLPENVVRDFVKGNPLCSGVARVDLIPGGEDVFLPGLPMRENAPLMNWLHGKVLQGTTAQGVPLVSSTWEIVWEDPMPYSTVWKTDKGDSAKKSHSTNEKGETGQGKTATEKWASERLERPPNFVWSDVADKIRAFQEKGDPNAEEGKEKVDIGGRRVAIKRLELIDVLSRPEHTPEVTDEQEKLLKLSQNVAKAGKKVVVYALLPRPENPEAVFDSYSKIAQKRCIDSSIQIHMVQLIRGCNSREDYDPQDLAHEYAQYAETREAEVAKLGKSSKASRHVMGRFEWAARRVDGAYLNLGCGCCGTKLTAWVVRPRDVERDKWLVLTEQGESYIFGARVEAANLWTQYVAEPSRILHGSGEVVHHLRKYRHLENWVKKGEPYVQTGGQIGHGRDGRWGGIESPTGRIPTSMLVMVQEKNNSRSGAPDETPYEKQQWTVERRLYHPRCVEGACVPTADSMSQHLGNLGMQNRHVMEVLRTKRTVKVLRNMNGTAQTMEVNVKDVARVESAVVFWGTRGLHQGYASRGTRVVPTCQLFATASSWQEHTNFGIPDPLHPLPYDGEYDPMRRPPADFGMVGSREVPPPDRDPVFKDSVEWPTPLPGDTLPTRHIKGDGTASEYGRQSTWTDLIVPRRGRPVVKPPKTKEDPECFKDRVRQKSSTLSEVKAYDEYDEEGRMQRTEAYPPGDRHRGWWACSILIPKPNTRLQTLTRDEVIIICWVQQMTGDGWTIAWTISAHNFNTGRDQTIGQGWWAEPFLALEDPDEDDDDEDDSDDDWGW